MATTISAAKDKLRIKIPSMGSNYSRSMSDFMGADVSGSIPVKSYKAKVTPGMEDRWEKGLRGAFGV